MELAVAVVVVVAATIFVPIKSTFQSVFDVQWQVNNLIRNHPGLQLNATSSITKVPMQETPTTLSLDKDLRTFCPSKKVLMRMILKSLKQGKSYS